jgi:hypothetical protein
MQEVEWKVKCYSLHPGKLAILEPSQCPRKNAILECQSTTVESGVAVDLQSVFVVLLAKKTPPSL